MYDIANHEWPPIDRLASWSQIVIAYAAIFAIAQYANSLGDTADRKTKMVLDLVKFFRESVLGKEDEVLLYLKKNKMTLPGFRVSKNTPFLEFTEREYFKKIKPDPRFNDQLKTFDFMASQDIEMERQVRSCLNALEEFAIGIINSKSENHPAAASVKKPLVEAVEIFTVPLYSFIGVRDDSFRYLSELYRHWKKEIRFIPVTPDEKEERTKERSKKYSK